MDDDKIKEGSIICKVNKKRVDPPSEDSETPLDGAVLPPSSDDVGTLSIEPPSFSTDIPPASDGKNEENVQHLPFCSDDIVLDLRMLSSGGDSQNCIPKKFESELDDKMPSIKKLDANPAQVAYKYPTPPNPISLPIRPNLASIEEDNQEKSSEFVDEMPPCSNRNDIANDLRNTQIPGITCRITIVVNKASESG